MIVHLLFINYIMSKKDNEGFTWEFFTPRAAPKTKAELESRVALFKKRIFIGIGSLAGMPVDTWVSSAFNVI